MSRIATGGMNVVGAGSMIREERKKSDGQSLARTSTKSVPSVPAPHRRTITPAARNSGARSDKLWTEIEGAVFAETPLARQYCLKDVGPYWLSPFIASSAASNVPTQSSNHRTLASGLPARLASARHTCPEAGSQ